MCLLWHSAPSPRGAQWGRTGSTVWYWDPDPACSRAEGAALQAEWLVQSYQRWMIVTALNFFLKFLKFFNFFFSSQGWSAATAHSGSWWAMLSIWVQALSCAGHATSAWLGVTGPQVPSAKGLTEPLMNNFFFPLLSLFQCQHHPACWWRGAFYIV